MELNDTEMTPIFDTFKKVTRTKFRINSRTPESGHLFAIHSYKICSYKSINKKTVAVLKSTHKHFPASKTQRER